MNEDVSPIKNATFPSSHVSFFGGKKPPVSHVTEKNRPSNAHKLFHSPWTRGESRMNADFMDLFMPTSLVGGGLFPTHSEKTYASQIGSFPLRGENSKKKLKPPT